jgi:hypothetical protein
VWRAWQHLLLTAQMAPPPLRPPQRLQMQQLPRLLQLPPQLSHPPLLLMVPAARCLLLLLVLELLPWGFGHAHAWHLLLLLLEGEAPLGAPRCHQCNQCHPSLGHPVFVCVPACTGQGHVRQHSPHWCSLLPLLLLLLLWWRAVCQV